MPFIQHLLYPGKSHEYFACRDPLGHLHNIGRRHLRMRGSKYMDMVLFSNLTVGDSKTFVCGNFLDGVLHVLNDVFRQHFAPVLCAEHDVVVTVKDTGSAMLDIAFYHSI